jgi:hypothetical protein
MTVFVPKGPHLAWPAWRTGPSGERQLFEKAEDVPEGWVDPHAAAESKAKPAAPESASVQRRRAATRRAPEPEAAPLESDEA